MSEETSYKVLFVGASKVGKSTIISKYIGSGPPSSTCGAVATTIQIPYNNSTVNVQLWDTAGQDEFRRFLENYSRGAHLVVLIYSTEDQDSVDRIPGLYYDVKNWAGDFKTILVMNKNDLKCVVNLTGVEQWAEENHFDRIPTSALTGTNIRELFSLIAKKLTASDAPPAPVQESCTPKCILL